MTPSIYSTALISNLPHELYFTEILFDHLISFNIPEHTHTHTAQPGDIMPFTSPKLLAQGHPPPANTALPYTITAYYGYVLLWSTLTTTNAGTLMAGHTVTATIRQGGNQPGTNTPYPNVTFHTYVYTRNGRPNDVLAAELSDPQNYLRNTNYLITLRVTDASGALIGLSIMTTVRFL